MASVFPQGMEIDPQQYPYPILHGHRSIRLLQLAPGVGNEPVVIRLFSVDLNAAPFYDAISYVWGDSQDTVPIFCGDDGGFSLAVTRNLHRALVRARSPREATVLWADAICINQQDLAERSHQVRFMCDIYSRARLVLVCLGDEPRAGDAGTVERVIAEVVAARGGNPTSHGADPLVGDPGWQSVARIMADPWFSRAWVVQEVGVARQPVVLYGSSRFGYRDLMRTIWWADDMNISIAHGVGSLLIHRVWMDWSDEWWREKGARIGLGLFDLLNHGCLLNCKDPRDHIYAFLGHPLCRQTNTQEPILRPDYTKDVRDVYREVTILLLRQVGARVLTVVEHTEETINDASCPSWVVRWNVHEIWNDILGDWKPPPDFPLEIPFTDGETVVFKGILADVVLETFSTHVSDEGLAFLVGDVFPARRKLDVLGLLSHVGTKLAAKFDDRPQIGYSTTIRFPNVGDLAQALMARKRPFSLDNLCSALRLYSVTNPPTYLSQRFRGYSHLGDLQILAHTIRETGRGRKLVITSKGYFGLAPQVTAAGDTVSILGGLPVPVLLRSGFPHCWRVLGEAYFHGLMPGIDLSYPESYGVEEHQVRLA